MALNLDAIGKKIGPLAGDYTWQDVILYALGVGAGFDELDYVYENRLKVIPSFFCHHHLRQFRRSGRAGECQSVRHFAWGAGNSFSQHHPHGR